MSENLGKGDRNLNCDVILKYLKVTDLLLFRTVALDRNVFLIFIF